MTHGKLVLKLGVLDPFVRFSDNEIDFKRYPRKITLFTRNDISKEEASKLVWSFFNANIPDELKKNRVEAYWYPNPINMTPFDD
jgi:hypothetical protein